ncbi:MAG: CheR family methyltransferase [bacterium]
MVTGSPSLKESPLLWIKDYVHREYGLYFSERKMFTLESKLKRRVYQLELDSIEEYAEYFRGNPDEVPFFLDTVTTNKTDFFRELPHWHYFEQELIPAWQDKKEIRIWSAACSSGEEPYTAGLLLEREKRKSRYDIPPYRILASDISEEVLRQGTRAVYPDKSLEPVRKYDPSLSSDFFHRDQQTNYRLDDSVKENVFFRQFNLKFKNRPFRKKFHLIMVRNVLIYFDQAMIQNVISNCERLLVDKGILMISHTETLQGIDHDLNQVKTSIFQKSEG